MKLFVFVFVLASGAACRAGEITSEVLREINLARTSPREYAEIIASTWHDSPAVREAVAFLRRAKPCPPVSLSEAMSLASHEHVADQGARGVIGHRSSDGSSPWARLSRFGKWSGAAGEVICYGRHSAREAVSALIIDEGVPGRSHRKNIFNSAFSVAGIAWGGHARWGTMCVVDFATSFTAETGAASAHFAKVDL